MLYRASTMLNAFGFYYAQNNAGIIRQGLVCTRPFRGKGLGSPSRGKVKWSAVFKQSRLQFGRWSRILTLVGNTLTSEWECHSLETSSDIGLEASVKLKP